MVNNLAAAGDEASETNLIVYILGGLGSDCEPVYTILVIKLEQYTIEEVQNHLLAYASKLDQLNISVTFDLSNSFAHFVSKQYDHNVRNTSQINFPAQHVNSSYNVCDIDESCKTADSGGYGNSMMHPGYLQRANLFLVGVNSIRNDMNRSQISG